MKIIYLHQYFKTPQMSGGTRSFEFAKRLILSGHEVHMITTHQGESKKTYKDVVAGINVHYLYIPYNNKFSYFKRILAFFKYIIFASFYILKIQCDLIFATSTPLTVAIPALIYKKINKVPMVFEVRDLWPEIPIAIGAIKSKLIIKLAKILEIAAYKNSKFIIALSPGMKSGILKNGISEDKVVTIPNSCDIQLFNISPSVGEKFKDERRWLKNKKLVLYTGTFGYINGVSFMVHLSKAMEKINNNIIFLAIGEGKEYQKIYDLSIKKNVLNKNFFIMESVRKEAMPEILSAATICTSLFKPYEEMWNNSANKFFDALAAGKPIMINYQGWQSQLLNETKSGITVPYDDIFSAAEILNNFISDKEKLDIAAENSLKLANEKFNRNKLYEDFENTLINATK